MFAGRSCPLLSFRFWVAFFLALGTLISFCPREGRTREAPLPENGQRGLGRHFAAAWTYLGNAVAHEN